MKEIDENKTAWGLLSRDHYEHFKIALTRNKTVLSNLIQKELGDINGKTILHLQCNTGADTISLARMGATVTGIDLVPDNIMYANKLAAELNIKNVKFIEEDLMEMDLSKYNDKYDIVFTSEGVLCWLPDLQKWADIIGHFLKDDGLFYLNDSHPFFMMLNENILKNNELKIKYPYFKKEAENDEWIGGYAAEPKRAKNHGWMYTIGEILNSLMRAGLYVENFNEYDTLFFQLNGMIKNSNGEWHYPFFTEKMPFQFSLKARILKK
ncbi:MAG: class I SAM-dependent methyltransferase [Spirochaetaceae bacterium]|jgi:SAM-dependent methyltransferase|nr:class I SAM-dependent methyltransferase [Spirochaetaceae bacterium]